MAPAGNMLSTELLLVSKTFELKIKIHLSKVWTSDYISLKQDNYFSDFW